MVRNKRKKGSIGRLLLVFCYLVASNEAFVLWRDDGSALTLFHRCSRNDRSRQNRPIARHVAITMSAETHSSFANQGRLPSRRDWMKEIIGTSLSSLGSAAVAFAGNPLPSVAEEGQTEQGLVSTQRLADLLRAVPTFTIVDQKGVPFMVVGEDAKVTGYFFIDYDEAQRILRVADKSAETAIAEAIKEDISQASELTNPWKNARISTVPLDFAVTLITKSLYDRRAGGNYFQIAPSAEQIENALSVTGKEDLAEGKVPLFYYEDFTLPAKDSVDAKPQTPLYFELKQLETAFRQANGKSAPLPPTKVTELFAVLLEMVKPGGTDVDLANLVFVPPPTSSAGVQACQKRARNAPPFLLGQRNIIL